MLPRRSIAAVVLLFGIVGCSREAPEMPPAAEVTLTAPSNASPVDPATADLTAGWRQATARSVTAVESAVAAMGTAVQSVDIPAARRACDDLDAAKRLLLKQLPAPDATLTTAVRGAVANIDGAVKVCRSFGPNSTGTEFDRYSSMAKDAIAQLNTSVGMASP
jgi:hypothetical protein